MKKATVRVKGRDYEEVFEGTVQTPLALNLADTCCTDYVLLTVKKDDGTEVSTYPSRISHVWDGKRWKRARLLFTFA